LTCSRYVQPIAAVNNILQNKLHKMRLTLFSEKNKAGLRQMEGHMVYTMDEIRVRLADRKLPVVADACGIPYPTLWRLMVGRQEAKQSVLQALTNYIGGTHGNAQ
jgi:hypothetical protein